MKKLVSLLCLFAVGLPLAGCRVAALTAAGAYAYNKGDENKANFAKVNADRQAHGLPPLTWDEYMNPGTNPTPGATGNGTAAPAASTSTAAGTTPSK